VVRARPSLRQSLAVAGLVALTAATLGGCSATNSITTTLPYSPSDGVRAELGDLTAENLLVLSAGTGKAAALQGAFTNRGTTSLTVSVTSKDGTSAGSVTVAAGATVLLGGPTGTVVDFTAGDPPGAVTPLTLTTTHGGTLAVSVPVLDGTFPQYATSVPTTKPSSAPTPTHS